MRLYFIHPPHCEIELKHDRELKDLSLETVKHEGQVTK